MRSMPARSVMKAMIPSPHRSFELLTECCQLRLQVGHFVAKLSCELLEGSDPVRGAAGSHGRNALRRMNDLTGQQVSISHFFLARPTRQAGYHGLGFANDQPFETRVEATRIVARHEPRGAAPDFCQRLRAS